jgi:hypothetical protein
LQRDLRPIARCESMRPIQTQKGRTSDSRSQHRQRTRFLVRNTTGETTTKAIAACISQPNRRRGTVLTVPSSSNEQVHRPSPLTEWKKTEWKKRNGKSGMEKGNGKRAITDKVRVMAPLPIVLLAALVGRTFLSVNLLPLRRPTGH